jgi:8-oxo-dGTP pyrophosphatase MutT (NUDIX family)
MIDYSENDKSLKWKIIKSSTMYDARIFKLRSVLKEDSIGRRASFVSLDSPDWVTVIPELITQKNNEENSKEFLVVRQYRHGTESMSMEFPAGLIDPGETPEEAAARELLEETGYRAAELTEIGKVSPNPAFMTNTTHTFLAKGLKKISKQDLDEHEMVDVYTISHKELSRQIGSDDYASAITVQAWYFYMIHSFKPEKTIT